MGKGIFAATIAFIFSIPFSFAYIDPGTGGYIIQSIWAWLVGVAAFLAAMTIHFFKVTLKIWAKRIWNDFKAVALVFGLIFLLAIIIGVYALLPTVLPGNPDFDPALSGAHWVDKTKSDGGYNLYEGKLIDMEGNLVHEWKNAIYLGVLDTNGDYYAQTSFESDTWGRYSWNDTIIWEKKYPIHHEILLTPWDTIYTFTKEVREYNDRMVEWDVILEVNKDGVEIDRWSTWENFEYLHSFHAQLELDKPVWADIGNNTWKNTSIWGGNFDYYHLNSMSLIPNNTQQDLHPAFKPGNWLISMRHGSMLFILDKDTKEVLWRGIYDQISDGKLEGQHTPHMLSDGSIIVFDNGRWRGWSRVIEIDPVNLKVTWEYKADDFFSLSQGGVQPLPNGNLLAIEGERGHVIELTRNKEIVWEFYHPQAQNSTNSVDEEQWGKRQQIYRMTRYDTDFIDQFLEN